MTVNILVVDDSHVERVLVEGLLRKNPEYRIQLAAHGREALRMIADQPPDVVITDLVMSEMDGLELVRRMRNRFPNIPVILMTAYGDESTAVQALELGAASYVPKVQKAERLMSAVERVTESASMNRSRRKLTRCMLEYHCRFSLENDRILIHALVNQIQEVMVNMDFGDTVERIRVGEALEEALLNAMYHGNLEITQDELAKVRAELDDRMLDRLVEERNKETRICERRILVITHVTSREVRFVVRDEGCGFSTATVAGARPTDSVASGQRRGMTLIRSIMDEVTFNTTGNELVMRKSIRTPVQESDQLETATTD
jgi:CheY-like chemotaxis protein